MVKWLCNRNSLDIDNLTSGHSKVRLTQIPKAISKSHSKRDAFSPAVYNQVVSGKSLGHMKKWHDTYP